jgi:hypothetical protein
MDSQSIAGILAAIIASVVLVVAFAYGPIGQFGKSAKPTAVQQTAPAGDPGLAQLGTNVDHGLASAGRPLAERPRRTYIAFNGDVDA